MPEKKTIRAAQRAKREGKAPSTQAGEFVHEEIEHIREGKHEPISQTRSRARVRALKKESTAAASHTALSRQTHAAAKKRTASERSAAAKKAAVTKGPRGRSSAAKKAAATKGPHGRSVAAKKAARTRARRAS
ncbi:DNA-binding protein [Chitinophagaceae bacterium LB-8]|uniref:DNA-binding protein n=1 Tax=Paraflavisolibacter caeni TaxID=2982496 RepID=A0A9X2XXJ7_9BACT|nr:DNA-binding protein [Paraflavisolibacter caeni]MCU7551201.1 DNA-binding protein [Paraflavisolibacter caeni]